MPNQITNLRSMKGMGVFADRDARMPPLTFKRYNLIYGFNGSGKSTLSRLFMSLQMGRLHERLPEGSSFEVEFDDGAIYGPNGKMDGLENRLVVFNSDYVEQNLQWTIGLASPVFFIGANQADAAIELTKIEGRIAKQSKALVDAEAAEKSTERAFSLFKRERAREIAGFLHLAGRKYEAPALTRDVEAWTGVEQILLDRNQLDAIDETLRMAEPLPTKDELNFDAATVAKTYDSILEVCGQSLSSVALEAVQRFPEILLWLQKGLEFHNRNKLDTCLFCGNELETKRKTELAAALDDQVDQFVDKITRSAERLRSILAAIDALADAVPHPEEVIAEQRLLLKTTRIELSASLQNAKKCLETLAIVLVQKQAQPAVPADISGAASRGDVEAAVDAISKQIQVINAVITAHNTAVSDFAKSKTTAEESLRKHFTAECRDEFVALAKEHSDAKDGIEKINKILLELRDLAIDLRTRIREHGPAASAINKLIASYLGHNELSIHPIEQGYELHRHGRQIKGLPSEGEKTAIAIAYFLSSLEADGRKLKDLIIVIDDPVSSLDTKGLNYACSLVRNRTADANQLFVLTHNLQCMGEFRKAWKGKARPPEGKNPTASLLFIDVTIPQGRDRRVSNIGEMSKLLREYDSEYHYLFSHIIQFTNNPNTYYDHGYMMPNVVRRVLDVFLAFKCPGSAGLSNQITQLCKQYELLDRDQLTALERLVQVESHSDNLDDLLSFSSMTLEETRRAADALLNMMNEVDEKHLANLKKVCS